MGFLSARGKSHAPAKPRRFREVAAAARPFTCKSLKNYTKPMETQM
jgi:hypothetical protein